MLTLFLFQAKSREKSGQRWHNIQQHEEANARHRTQQKKATRKDIQQLKFHEEIWTGAFYHQQCKNMGWQKRQQHEQAKMPNRTHQNKVAHNDFKEVKFQGEIWINTFFSSAAQNLVNQLIWSSEQKPLLQIK